MHIESRKVGKCIVEKYKVYGIPHPVFDVYEPTDSNSNIHSTFTYINEQCYGDFTSRRLPPHIDKLPPLTEKRSQAVQTYLEKRKQAARKIAQLAFPGEEIHF